MKLKGRVINGGNATGEAVVLDMPFSFIGEFDPDTGELRIEGHPLSGESLANKILVCPTGKGGTIAPFIAYQAWQKGKAPAAILCQEADPILCECGITINVPVLSDFSVNLMDKIHTGQIIRITADEVEV